MKIFIFLGYIDLDAPHQKIIFGIHILIWMHSIFLICIAVLIIFFRQITLLTELSSQIKSDSAAKNMVNVDRDDILDGACRAFSRTRFNQWAPLSVKFSGEQGIDNGGLTRAFLQLAISAIHDSQIFGGENGKKVLNHNYQGNFFIIPRCNADVVGYSIAGRPSICAFSL